MSQLQHGGNVQQASQDFGKPADGWLDLSTGISPWAWPVPSIPEALWQRLPDSNQSLCQAAAVYYQCPEAQLLAGCGSQEFIQLIPQSLSAAAVAIPAVGYQEHARAWRQAGHCIHYYRSYTELLALLGPCQHAVVINPNNPSAMQYSAQDLLAVHAALGRDGVLVVDEAFVDSDAANSLSAYTHLPGLYVLRSVGKFFGLAGMRLGFCLTADADALRDRQVPWNVSHPAQWLGEQALRDKTWQACQRQRLAEASDRQLQVLKQAWSDFSEPAWSRTNLFITLCSDKLLIHRLYRQMAESGILLRCIDDGEQAYLRFGLAGEQLSRLEQTLKSIKP